jgi:hypothetical protein
MRFSPYKFGIAQRRRGFAAKPQWVLGKESVIVHGECSRASSLRFAKSYSQRADAKAVRSLRSPHAPLRSACAAIRLPAIQSPADSEKDVPVPRSPFVSPILGCTGAGGCREEPLVSHSSRTSTAIAAGGLFGQSDFWGTCAGRTTACLINETACETTAKPVCRRLVANQTENIPRATRSACWHGGSRWRR